MGDKTGNGMNRLLKESPKQFLKWAGDSDGSQELTGQEWKVQPQDAGEEDGRLYNWIPGDSKVWEGKGGNGLGQREKDTRSSLKLER